VDHDFGARAGSGAVSAPGPLPVVIDISGPFDRVLLPETADKRCWLPCAEPWASGIEPGTVEQAARAARLPFIPSHVALMPDAHVGMGATVGSLIPTQGAIIPSAVGVDIGCGMVATETDLTAADLPDSLAALMPLIEQRIPAGVGQGHDDPRVDSALDALGRPHTSLTGKQETTTAAQFGTLGSGNHFVEVCLDERDGTWTETSGRVSAIPRRASC
jgi:RNA-splicing ligase RtcB